MKIEVIRMENLIAVTGMGVITANAKNIHEFQQALKEGRDGVKEVSLFDVSSFACQTAAEIKDFKPHNHYPSQYDRAAIFALEAAEMAIVDAGLDLTKCEKERVGVILGTTMGGVISLEKFYYSFKYNQRQNITPGLECEHTLHGMTDHVAERFQLEGPKSTISIACASGTQSIGYAADFILQNRADIMLAGGADSLSQFVFSGFSSLRALTRFKNKPFDKNRDGLILGEGAGILVLERLGNALRRGATIHAIYRGYGFSNDANHPTNPDKEGKGLERAIHYALKDSQVAKDQIDYINAHGTGTKANDVMECNALKNVFGENAYQIPISTIKPMVGHTLGAAGSVEAIATILSLKHNFMPPTLNYQMKDPECDLDIIPNQGREKELNIALSTSSGFSGNNSAILFEKYKEGAL